MVKIEIHDDSKVFYNGEYYGVLDCAVVQQESGTVTIQLSIDCREIEKCP